jgi:hypothetical protein
VDTFDFGRVTAGPECEKERQQMFFARVGRDGARCLAAIVEQRRCVARLQAICQPVRETADIGRDPAAVACRQLVVAQVVRDVAGGDDEKALFSQRCERLARAARPVPARRDSGRRAE